MHWERVVQAGFGDPQNHDLAFITAFSGKLIAATCTRGPIFGAPSGFGSGVEVWESATGDPGTWVQINLDGFGEEAYIPSVSKKVRINQDIGAFAIYKGALYVGTMAHFGAQVWRYQGGGAAGWTEVTPPWGGPGLLASDPKLRMLRANAMAVFDGYLYLGEGFPSGNLSRYDGNTWTKVAAGPHPFDPQNRGINSLAVAEDICSRPPSMSRAIPALRRAIKFGPIPASP